MTEYVIPVGPYLKRPQSEKIFCFDVEACAQDPHNQDGFCLQPVEYDVIGNGESSQPRSEFGSRTSGIGVSAQHLGGLKNAVDEAVAGVKIVLRDKVANGDQIDPGCRR